MHERGSARPGCASLVLERVGHGGGWFCQGIVLMQELSVLGLGLKRPSVWEKGVAETLQPNPTIPCGDTLIWGAQGAPGVPAGEIHLGTN